MTLPLDERWDADIPALIAWVRAQIDTDEQVAKDADPARRCRLAIDRQILDLSAGVDLAAEFPNYDGGRSAIFEDVVRLLGSCYADRPGYRPEWRPWGVA